MWCSKIIGGIRGWNRVCNLVCGLLNTEGEGKQREIIVNRNENWKNTLLGITIEAVL